MLPAHAQSSVVCDATVTIVRVASGTAPLGFTAYCSYTPTTTPPSSVSATIGNLPVTSGLTQTSPGNFTFNFAADYVGSPADSTLRIVVTFQDDCTDSASFPLQLCNATVTIVRVASGTTPLGFTAYCSYTPTTTPPSSVSATIGNLPVTSGGLTQTSPGNFTFNFASDYSGVPADFVLRIVVTFQDNCTGSASFPVQICNATVTILGADFAGQNDPYPNVATCSYTPTGSPSQHPFGNLGRFERKHFAGSGCSGLIPFLFRLSQLATSE